MKDLFANATSFNGDISKWNLAKVSSMDRMFFNARLFNIDISKWNVAKVTTMQGMFFSARLFNIDISKWDVSKVTDMEQMFWDADSFNRTLCGEAWVKSTADKTRMFDGSPGSICGLWSIVIVVILFLRNLVSSSPQHHTMSNQHLSFFSAVIMLTPTYFLSSVLPALFIQAPMHSPPNLHFNHCWME